MGGGGESQFPTPLYETLDLDELGVDLLYLFVYCSSHIIARQFQPKEKKLIKKLNLKNSGTIPILASEMFPSIESATAL